MKHSEQLDKIGAALAKAQSEMEPAIKDKTNPFFKANYADLASVWAACRKALADNGLSVAQGLGGTVSGDGYLWTTLLHSSGQFITGECPMILGKRDPQGVGSAMTYYRRYGLAAILGITQEDDDAQGAMKPKQETKQEAAPNSTMDAAMDTVEKYKLKLQAAKTVQALQDVWKTIPAVYHKTLLPICTEQNTALTKGTANA